MGTILNPNSIASVDADVGNGPPHKTLTPMDILQDSPLPVQGRIL